MKIAVKIDCASSKKKSKVGGLTKAVLTIFRHKLFDFIRCPWQSGR
ncbi:hypothetical protein NBRC111894_4108 [Sporolactobacillus inulinus]|uniref:Uncharacterized protein n=1 Tax=Sporolactobacillus inulinus TaxID=2078 RepID=A0A4Y1ZI20_9BACL|nr:hypothetical protein NBRC111894_4108 [Sporolactobacillus inulinus]